MVAVYCVVFQHITHQSPINHPELGPYPIVLTLQFGASTLIVVSAYFICVTVRRGRTVRWLWNRLARLLPPYLVAVVVTYLVGAAAIPLFNADPGTPLWYQSDRTDLVANLLLVQGWSSDFHWIDASYWTLPLQVSAFIVAALLWPRGWVRGRGVQVLLWSLVVVPLVLRVFRTEDAPQWFRSAFDGLALHRVALFGVGIAIWLWSAKRMSAVHLGGYLLAALVAQDAHAHFADTVSTIAFGVVLLAIVAAAGGPDWDLPVLRTIAPAITWLGGISYGVYLVHQELGFVLARFLRDAGIGPWVRIVACVAFAVLLGLLLNRLVERPAHRWLVDRAPAVLRRGRVLAVSLVESRGMLAPLSDRMGAAALPRRELEWAAVAGTRWR